jgi:hypothetical protein
MSAARGRRVPAAAGTRGRAVRTVVAVATARARRAEQAERRAAELLGGLTPTARRRMLAAVAVLLGHDALARELVP